MKNFKQPCVAGMFYPDYKDELLKQIGAFKTNAKRDYEYKTRAVIVPHAGYVYSGQLAYEGVKYLDESVENVFIFAPAHRQRVEKTAVSECDGWTTPLGNIEINQDINRVLIEKFGAKFFDGAFDEEHAVEVQLPLLQNHLNTFKIIPVLIGGEDPNIIKVIIEYFYDDTKNAFVISSDLSHFHNNSKAVQIDNYTAQMIESNNVDNFSYEQACGICAIFGLTSFSLDKGFSLIRIGLHNSGDITGDNQRVVGYGSWLLYEGEKNSFLKKYFSDYIIKLCKQSIDYKLTTKKKMTKDNLGYIPEVFNEEGACFVTLEINHQLRGCIGSIIAHTSLIEDLISNSYSSAFSDPRFKQLGKNEFNEIKINVSLLSSPAKMYFHNEHDLIEQIVPYEDGIIIKDGNNQSVYLPSVWEQLPDRTDFLQSLKVKAGLNPYHFSDKFEAYKFKSDYITET